MIYRVEIFCIISVVLAMQITDANADVSGDEVGIRMGEVFHRTMKHWNYSYPTLDTTKAGVACVRWEDINPEFLNDGIFEAIGFSFSVANEGAAIRIATQGCERMSRHYEVTDCTCEVILVDDAVRVSLPDTFTD